MSAFDSYSQSPLEARFFRYDTVEEQIAAESAEITPNRDLIDGLLAERWHILRSLGVPEIEIMASPVPRGALLAIMEAADVMVSDGPAANMGNLISVRTTVQ